MIWVGPKFRLNPIIRISQVTSPSVVRMPNSSTQPLQKLLSLLTTTHTTLSKIQTSKKHWKPTISICSTQTYLCKCSTKPVIKTSSRHLGISLSSKASLIRKGLLIWGRIILITHTQAPVLVLFNQLLKHSSMLPCLQITIRSTREITPLFLRIRAWKSRVLQNPTVPTMWATICWLTNGCNQNSLINETHTPSHNHFDDEVKLFKFLSNFQRS
jgi:hypothetical protein